EERNQIEEEPVAIGFALQQLDRGKENDQVTEYCDFDAATLSYSTLEISNIEPGAHQAPIQIEERQRQQNHHQSHALRQLPAPAFQLPRRAHHQREGHRQPQANSARDKQRQGRGG